MRILPALLLTALLLTAGCAGFTGDDDDRSRLDLTVQNDGEQPMDVDVTVEADNGTVIAEESDRVDSGVARAFEFTAGASGRHEVVVSGDDWQGSLAWNADTCARYDATVRVTDETVDVAGECLQQR